MGQIGRGTAPVISYPVKDLSLGQQENREQGTEGRSKKKLYLDH